MKYPGKLSGCSFLLVAVFLGTSCTSANVNAQCPDLGTIGFNGVVAAEGKPFQATAVMTVVTFGGDGTKQVRATKSHLFRDSKGRVRVERFYDGTDDPAEIVPMDILIYDNCGTSVSLSPATHIARISKIVPRPNPSHLPFCGEVDLNNPPQPGPDGKFEYLGHKMIDGVEVWGERTTYYKSVEAKLAGNAPSSINDSWCSTSLETPMGSFSLKDNPKLESATVIKDLKPTEPEPSLFEIPKEYKITRADQSAPASSAPSGASNGSKPK